MPAPDYFMKFNANSATINCTICAENEVIVNGTPYTIIKGISGEKGNGGQLRITIYEDENNLKTGQVYTSQSTNSLTFKNAVSFAFVPDTLVDNPYGFTTAAYNPTGTVTLTEVTPTYIKGTFSASLFVPADYYGANLIYAITNGTFYSNHNVNEQVIPL